LIDPVALSIYFPDTLYTVFYKPPRTIYDYIFCYYLTYDITIAYNIQRHFKWHEAVIFLEDVPPHIGLVIGIAMQDDFLCSRGTMELVDRFIEANDARAPIRKLVWETFGHADAIINREAMQDMVAVINANEREIWESQTDILQKKIS